eukprot:Skav215192  [mRNA]  locus=scaffold3330:115956:124684:- [translate_table: standard]
MEHGGARFSDGAGGMVKRFEAEGMMQIQCDALSRVTSAGSDNDSEKGSLRVRDDSAEEGSKAAEPSLRASVRSLVTLLKPQMAQQHQDSSQCGCHDILKGCRQLPR